MSASADQQESARRPAAELPPIFVQAMWRTGSTYVWKKFREQAQYRAYYEPLHECYGWPRAQVEQVCGADARAALRHPAVEDYYCREMPFTAQGGVEHFEKPLSYQRYCLAETAADPALARYIGNLIGHAARQGQRAVLQFNRGLLRAGWLARNFPSPASPPTAPIQILVLRRPLNIWKSFARYPSHTFHAYVCTILGQNKDQAPLRHLPRWLDVPCHIADSFAGEYAFYQPYAAANLERLYPTFFDFNLVATLHAAQYADCILDLDEISANPAVRLRAERRLAELGIAMSLDDCAVPGYPADSADPEWRAYEDFSLGYLSRILPPEISITPERAAAHAPLLSGYFRQVLAAFTARHAPETPPAGMRNNMSHDRYALAEGLFARGSYEEAATLLGALLPEQPDGARWNDWAAAQGACRRPHLAELGFQLALRTTPPEPHARVNLGALLLDSGRAREALPLLTAAELEAADLEAAESAAATAEPARQGGGPEQRAALSELVNRARAELHYGPPLPPAATAPAASAALGGLTIFLTGLSGAGKSTLAAALQSALAGRDPRAAIVLDGDDVRRYLSSELGYSREHRDLNIRRIGYVAAQITRAGGIAICACIAPYDAARREVRAMIEPAGRFLLVHVATALEVCEQRDVKGLYARARAGLLPRFTGISDPYEPPADAELTIDTQRLTVAAATQAILARLGQAAAVCQEKALISVR